MEMTAEEASLSKTLKVKWCIIIAPFLCDMLKGALQ